MGNRYVNVTITRQTQPVSQQGFGLPLILGTSKASAYKEYANLAAVSVDFAETTEEYKIASALFGQAQKPEKVAIHSILWDEATGVPTDLTAALNTLVLTHNEWYFLLAATQDDEAITALAQWASAQMKIYFVSTANEVLSGTLNAERAVVQVHPNPETYPAEAWVGYGATKDAGSFTWTFKTLNGIAPANYTSSEVDAIHDANGNTYIREGGVNITSAGKTTSGEYIDIIMGQDYIQSRMTENVFGLLARTPKVPFTDNGIAMVVAEVEKALKDAAQKGILATDSAGNPIYTVSAPTAADISANDKANRALAGISWAATVAGAVEDVDINGSLEL